MPALRAGYVMLTDRYIYSLMARAIVRGALQGGQLWPVPGGSAVA